MNRIKELREECRMSQVRLGIELEVTQETVSAYENGKHYPSAKSLIKMTSLFGASIDYILGISDIRLPVNTEMQVEEQQALLLLRRMNTSQKGKSIAYMQGLLETT